MNLTSKLIFLCAAALCLTGCPPKKKSAPAESETPMVDQKPEESSDMEIGSDWSKPPILQPAYFETNRADLSTDGRAALKKNAAVLKAIVKEYPSIKIRIEGNCDERNTVEYNLALGQQRANRVRDYYKTLGIKSSSLATISFGEEKPVCSDASEDCWWRNRRADTTLKSESGVLRIPKGRFMR